MNLKEDRRLSKEEKQKIYDVIYRKMKDDDKFPSEVIAEDFNGDEDAYLRRMAKWHDISL